jgi:hypothetical protein
MAIMAGSGAQRQAADRRCSAVGCGISLSCNEQSLWQYEEGVRETTAWTAKQVEALHQG